MQHTTLEERLAWIFRIAIAMCFIGHGAFGIITKEEWVPFFAVVGMSRDTAYALMPLIGTLDIALGLLVLFRPTRAVLLYMGVWCIWTAALRPLSGDSFFELLERAGNYGIPIAFLVLLGPTGGIRGWLSRAAAPALTPAREEWMRRVLGATTALLLIGHAGLALAQKPVLVRHAALLGLDASSVLVIGGIEVALAILVLLSPRPTLLLGVLAWKLGTEMLWPLAGAPVWEFIERAGSYAAPLLLAMLALRRVVTQPLRYPGVAGFRLVAVLIAILGAPVALPAQQHEHGQGQVQDRVPINPPGILDSLKQGGYVIACRHAATDHSQGDRGPAREQQRNLTAAGEAQARHIGAVIRQLGIPIGEVRSSTVFRNQETAEYAFGKPVVDSVLAGKGLRPWLVAPVARGTNRALVVRQGTIYDNFGNLGVRDTQEGDCFIVRPVDSASYDVLGRLRVAHWKAGPSF